MVEGLSCRSLPCLSAQRWHGSPWDMCLPATIEIHEAGSPLCLSYHGVEPSRTLWHAVLETNHKRVLSLAYCDHEKSRGMIIRCDNHGTLTTDVLIHSFKETAFGGRLPPNLLDADHFPTRNLKHIRGIHAHFQRFFNIAGV